VSPGPGGVRVHAIPGSPAPPRLEMKRSVQIAETTNLGMALENESWAAQVSAAQGARFCSDVSTLGD
jgi:hypothetical protein